MTVGRYIQTKTNTNSTPHSSKRVANDEANTFALTDARSAADIKTSAISAKAILLVTPGKVCDGDSKVILLESHEVLNPSFLRVQFCLLDPLRVNADPDAVCPIRLVSSDNDPAVPAGSARKELRAEYFERRQGKLKKSGAQNGSRWCAFGSASYPPIASRVSQCKRDDSGDGLARVAPMQFGPVLDFSDCDQLRTCQNQSSSVSAVRPAIISRNRLIA
jgi:hypothetical protein